MTEAEWLACTNPQKMLDYLDERSVLSDRKQRLFDSACVRRIWHLLTDARGKRAVELAEQNADGSATLDEVHEAQAAPLAARDAAAILPLPGATNSYVVLSAAAGAPKMGCTASA